jgi:predicted permease
MNSELDTTDDASPEPAGRRRLRKRAKIGIVLIILSFLIWFAIFAVPFLPYSGRVKWIVGVVLVICCYSSWFLGLFLAGREVAAPIMAWFWKWLPWKKSVKEDDEGG